MWVHIYLHTCVTQTHAHTCIPCAYDVGKSCNEYIYAYVYIYMYIFSVFLALSHFLSLTHTHTHTCKPCVYDVGKLCNEYIYMHMHIYMYIFSSRSLSFSLAHTHTHTHVNLAFMTSGSRVTNIMKNVAFCALFRFCRRGKKWKEKCKKNSSNVRSILVFIMNSIRMENVNLGALFRFCRRGQKKGGGGGQNLFN